MARRTWFPFALLPVLILVLAALPASAADEPKEKENPHAVLLDKPAPDFKGDFALNGTPTSLSDLKGKVVLLDFWAVWCGPCIATFPHLRDWHAEYKDKGLEIVGVTTYYEQFGFDKEKGKLARAKDKLTPVQEQDMIKDFAEHHKLAHRLMTLPRDERAKVYEAYKVKGIPTAVLIDRKGNVRMVKVGSSEANAEALGETIKKLIAE
jgi:thiol-disulfide isomerase/thioredoxin